MRKLKFIDYMIIILAFYFTGAIIQNVLAVKMIVINGITLFDCGTILSPFVFAIMDISTEVLEKNKTIKIFTLSTILNVFFTIIFQIAIILPCDDYDMITSFEMIFFTNWRIVLASCIAFWVGNYINTLIMHKMKKNNFILKAIISSVFGQLVDNSIFYFIAFAPLGIKGTYELSMNAILSSICIMTVAEIIIESAVSPLTKNIVNKLKKVRDSSYEN